MRIKSQNADWFAFYSLVCEVFFFHILIACKWFPVAPFIYLLCFNVFFHIQSSFDYFIWCYHISTNFLGWVGVADASDRCVFQCRSNDPKLIFQCQICYWWERHFNSIELFLFFFSHEALFHCWSSWYIMRQELFLSLGFLDGLHCWVGPLGNVVNFDRRVIVQQFWPWLNPGEPPKAKFKEENNNEERGKQERSSGDVILEENIIFYSCVKCAFTDVTTYRGRLYLNISV